MSTLSKLLLSGSTNGKNIKVAAIATPGTLIHTAVSGTTNKDEIIIYASNSSGLDVDLTIEWGEATNPDGHVFTRIRSYSGFTLIIPSLLLQNSLEVRAFASEANLVNINGTVIRETA
jgi:uncharacterized membrane protein